MADHAGKDEYPLSVMLDVFQSIQRQGAPFLPALTGLPTLFPRLVEARTTPNPSSAFRRSWSFPRELLVKGFSPSHASQILATLINSGVVFRNRHESNSFAVPLLGDFIRRQYAAEQPEFVRGAEG